MRAWSLSRVGVVSFLSLLAAVPAAAEPGQDVVAVFPVELTGLELSDDLRTSITAYVSSVIAEQGYRVIPQRQLEEKLAALIKSGHRERYDPSTQVQVGEAVAASQTATTQVIKIADICRVSVTFFDLQRSVSSFSRGEDGECDARGLRRSVQSVVASLPVPGGSSPLASRVRRKASKPGRLTVGVPTWGGYAGGIYFNGGVDPSSRSRFKRDYQLSVQFKRLDSIDASVRAWNAGEVDVMWITVDDLPTEYRRIARQRPRLFLQTAWSRGEEVLVVRESIRDLNDLQGRRIALEKNTTAHSFLLISLDLAGLAYDDVEVIAARNNRDAADLFIRGRADAAIVWVDEDERILDQVPGAYRLETSEDASYLIAECLVVKRLTQRDQPDAVAALAEGWLRANAELADPDNRGARSEAIRLLVNDLGVSRHVAEREMELVRFATLGDNINFFGDNPGYRGEKGEDLYDYFWPRYRAIDRTIPRQPRWRNLADDSIVRDITLSGRQHEAEPLHDFEYCLESSHQRQLSKKGLSVTFPSGRSTLSRDAERFIDAEFGHLAEIYFNDCIRIEGNTDSTGPDHLHQPLSKRRAEAVKRHLVDRYGFDPRRIITVGNGHSRPVASNGTAEGRAKNRRTDFELLH